MKKILLLILVALTSWIIAMPAAHALIGADDFGVDLAFARRVVSTESLDGNLNTHAVDANPSTRYAAQPTDQAFFYVDLGSREKVGKVVINWEAAYAKKYEIQLSNDAMSWTTAAVVENTGPTIDTIEFTNWIEAQFVKFQGVERGTQYGYSFYSFEVYGPKNLALGADVYEASSNENETQLNKAFVTDNLAHTRWASLQAAGDNQFLLFDLHDPVTFDLIKIRWEVSFARLFKVHGHPETGDTKPSSSDVDWFEITGSSVGLGEVDSLPVRDGATTRYIKLELIQRETSENTKKTGRLPWQSTFSMYSFELFKWSDIDAIPLGSVMEFSKNVSAWPAMTNITLNPDGLILAPQGYPIEADGVVNNMDDVADGEIPGFESYALYNPGVVYDEDNDIFHMIYRSELPDNFANYHGSKYAMGHMSTLSYAYSYDGVHFERGENNPIIWPTLSDEAGGGTEDPRVFKIVNDPNRGGLTTYYITYTMYNNAITRQGIAYTHDFETFHKVGNVAPGYNGALKSGSFLTDPEGNAVKINDPRPGKTGKVYMIYMKDGAYTRLGFTTDVLNIKPEDVIDIATSSFGDNSIEALTYANESCMAITNIYGPDDENIYLMYGGGRLSDGNIQHQQPNVSGWFYALGALKATKSNPFELTNISLDLSEPTIYPTDTNKIDYGLFNKCMFADSMIRWNDKWFLYYGAGDMYVGLATANGSFSAAAAAYVKDGDMLTISTYALNKSYGADQKAIDIQFDINVYDFEGNALLTQQDLYEIEHFLHRNLGSYDLGEYLEVTLDLSTIVDLPAQYYVSAVIKSADGSEILNNYSYYTVITPTISKVNK